MDNKKPIKVVFKSEKIIGYVIRERYRAHFEVVLFYNGGMAGKNPRKILTFWII